MQLPPMASSPDGLISAWYALITKTPGWECSPQPGGGGGGYFVRGLFSRGKHNTHTIHCQSPQNFATFFKDENFPRNNPRPQ